MEKELKCPVVLEKGSTGDDVRRVQEWLCLHGCATAIDGDFGPATEAAVSKFQQKKHIMMDGAVGPVTWDALVQSMLVALEEIQGASSVVTIKTDVGEGQIELPQTCLDYVKEKLPHLGLGQARNLVVAYAQQHLAQHPREVGGQNRGPWVRLYCGGHDGTAYPWCAGFVTFILTQAYSGKPPIKGSLGCDELAAQAKAAGLFVEGTTALKMANRGNNIPAGSVFLIRAKPGDWVHTGIVTRATSTVLYTIEGNTNDDGSREGYEVAARTRKLTDKTDFIMFK